MKSSAMQDDGDFLVEPLMQGCSLRQKLGQKAALSRPHIRSYYDNHAPIDTATMLPTFRTRGSLLLRRAAVRSYSAGVDHPPANDPKTPATTQNVSATNATPTSPMGSHDSPLVETVEEAEKMRTMQAPNRTGIWSRSQRPREQAMVGPRFEQTIMADQVCCNTSSAGDAMICMCFWYMLYSLNICIRPRSSISEQ